MDIRRWIVWGAAALLIAACSGGDATPTTVADTESPRPAGISSATPSPTTVPVATTAPPSLMPTTATTDGPLATTTTTAAPSPSVTPTVPPPTVSTEAPAPSPSYAFLVNTGDAVWQVDADGAAERLIAGPVAAAVDDTRGGVLYQFAFGRWFDDEAEDDTTIWWVPRGASAPQALLVATPGSAQRLTLHDAFATEDGFAVLYARHDGSIPDVDMVDRLRRLDVPGGDVTEIFAHGAFEQGFGDVRSNGVLIAGTSYDQVGSVCFVDDMTGTSTGLVPDIAGDPALETYNEGCRLSPDGASLWFFFETRDQDGAYESTTIMAWDLVAGRELYSMGHGTDASIGDIDVGDTHLVASRHALVAGGYGPASVWRLDDLTADPIELPLAGRARVLRAAVDIAGPVTP